MNRKQQINLLASRFARNKMAGIERLNTGFAIAAYSFRIWAFMRLWLDEHDALPEGVHILPEGTTYPPGKPGGFGLAGAIKVDFTKLRSDPEYPKRGRDDTYVSAEQGAPSRSPEPV